MYSQSHFIHSPLIPTPVFPIPPTTQPIVDPCAIMSGSSENRYVRLELQWLKSVIFKLSRGSYSRCHLKVLKDRFTRAIRHASRMNPAEIEDGSDSTLADGLGRDRATYRQPFTSIPLHAAHPFKQRQIAQRSRAWRISTSVPTRRHLALVRSRQAMKKRVSPSFVAIGQGQSGAGKGKALLAVDSELELVRKLVPATANCTTISGDAATRAGALEALEGNTWVHLTYRGTQDPAQPYNSHFVVRDEPLTLLDITEKEHSARRVRDEETPDEDIHLAAGLQFSGFKSVIGTLWGVDDAVAKYVVEAFYKYISKDLEDGGVMDCTKAAWALDCATHAVKMKPPLEQTMVFNHIGV
ncbi:hypothetical protein BDR03DRAFT_999401 [Suillus americanus]|nr:hypothetical protein BDR03DRAFT_999401 [Suillus americanus]